MHYTLLHFPQIHLPRRDGHKLRGYFANLFSEESDLFHNRTKDGGFKYRYPRIQYKIVRGEPMLVGIAEGGPLLVERFLRIKEIDIDGLIFPIHQKNLKNEECLVGVRNDLFEYEFVNPWLALNEKKYTEYEATETEAEKIEILKKILITNIINFFTAAGHRESERIMVSLNLQRIQVKFKDQPMVGFKGRFTTNAMLPDFVGFGKSVSRGFGTIQRV